MERVYKSPESPQTIEKLESSADHDLGNNQNAKPNIHLINTSLLYQKDHSYGLRGNVCTDHRYFHEEFLFLSKELDNKQKPIDNLLNIINYMRRNSDKPGKNFYETTNPRFVQINATAGERRFETQNRNNLTIENNT